MEDASVVGSQLSVLSIKEEIAKKMQKVLGELGVEGIEPQITVPQDLSHGDYTTNVAFSAFSNKRQEIGDKWKNPFELAQEVSSRFTLHALPFIDKVEAVRPGFINFTLSQDFLVTQLQEVLETPEKITRSTKMEKDKIVVEFTDPNPFKEFHIGHLYTNTVGESLARILESQGATVWRADYFGDVGMHVAKALFGLLQIFNFQFSVLKEEDVKKILSDLESKSLKERIKILGQAYAKGATAYEEDNDAAEQMKVINRLVYVAAQKMWEKEKGMKTAIDYTKDYTIDQVQLSCIYDLYTTGRKWSLEYFDSIYERLGMKFNGYYPESIAGEKGYQLVFDHIKDGVFEKSDGAIIFSGKNYGLHTRVFINSLGLPTYEAKELGLAPFKYEDFKYNRSIIVTGSEIKEYFKVLIAAMKAVAPELGNITTHLPHGMVRLPEGKMSSRTGKIVTGEWLIEEAVKHAKEMAKGSDKIQINSDKFRNSDTSDTPNSIRIPSEFHPETAELVGIGAIKYAFLKSGIGKDIEFDFETSLSLNGNSGPYLQYTYVRTQSILAKSKEQRAKSSLGSMPSALSEEELTLLRMLIHYPEVVSDAAENLAPSAIATYLYEFAKAFNLFYQKQRIVDAPTQEERMFRVSLTQIVGEVLKNGLYLLGIQAPSRM